MFLLHDARSQGRSSPCFQGAQLRVAGPGHGPHCTAGRWTEVRNQGETKSFTA